MIINRLTRTRILVLATVLFFMIGGNARSNPDFNAQLQAVQARWAEVNYELTGGAQKDAFDALLDEAREPAAANPARAEALVWQGIVASSYAGVKGPFGAMSLAKEARDALLAAEKMDSSVLHGSVYTSLGVLYYKVPGGIIGFGDRDKAHSYLQKALELNPDGIDPNYFFGEFLYDDKQYAAARDALLRARNAPARPGRELADEGRQREIDQLLGKVDGMLDHQT